MRSWCCSTHVEPLRWHFSTSLHRRTVRVRSCRYPRKSLITRRQPKRHVRVSAEMYVPSDSFGGISPEKKAANALRTLFTFVAVKVILAQLTGSGRGNLGAYNTEAYDTLVQFLEKEPLKDGDVWVEKLLKHNHMLGLRVLEVREAYCREEFEWENLKIVAIKDMKNANLKLMRSSVVASFSLSFENTTASAEPAVAKTPNEQDTSVKNKIEIDNQSSAPQIERRAEDSPAQQDINSGDVSGST